MMPDEAPEPFDSSAHIYEVIWDGLRAIVFVESGRVRVQDKYGRDVSRRFRDLEVIGSRVHGSGLAIDGEIVAMDTQRRPDIRRLARRLNLDDPDAIADLTTDVPVTFQAFDILYREGQPVTGWSLRRRKEMLRSLVRPSAAIAVPEWVARDGIAFFEAAREHQLEGIIAKELDSPYIPGRRHASWLAIKVHHRDEFVIAGFTYGGQWSRHGSRRSRAEGLHSVLLGAYDERDDLRFVGEATGGFTESGVDDLLASLNGLTMRECPFGEEPELGRLVSWCRPELSATIRYGGWAADLRLRFPVFEAARPDVPPSSCRLRVDA
jgi:ATP-dependent DNA ligase